VSRASEWAKAIAATRPEGIHAAVWTADVSAGGNLELRIGVHGVDMARHEALELARWILDTFGETTP